MDREIKENPYLMFHYIFSQRFNDFEVEPHIECTYDHLEVYDGDDSGADLLKRLCGSGLPKPITSTGSTMFMKFYSDPSVQKKGFHITHTTGRSLFTSYLNYS